MFRLTFLHKILVKSTKEPISDAEEVAEEIEKKIAAVPRENPPVSVADGQTKIYTNKLSNQIANTTYSNASTKIKQRVEYFCQCCKNTLN